MKNPQNFLPPHKSNLVGFFASESDSLKYCPFRFEFEGNWKQRPVKNISACVLTAFMALAMMPVKVAFSQQIVVGAWNIEWLGFADKRGKPGKDVVQSPKDLSDYIAQCKVDVLALEEIGVDENSEPFRSKPLDQVFDQLKENHNQTWQYVLFPKANYDEGTEDFIVRGQHTGLAWCTSKATMVGEPFRVPVGENQTYGIKFWERGANAVKLSFGSGKSDVVFIPIHLKSNRNDVDKSDKKFTEKQRLAEVEAFVANLPSLKEHFKDDDIVILGDSNFLAPEDGSPKVLAEAGFTDLNSQDVGTTAAWGQGYSSAPFDRIFVSSQQPEFAKSSQTVHKTKNGTDNEIRDYKKRFSDHYLVSCVIEIGNDDD
jgi:predicted extracellular nuclease